MLFEIFGFLLENCLNILKGIWSDSTSGIVWNKNGVLCKALIIYQEWKLGCKEPKSKKVITS